MAVIGIYSAKGGVGKTTLAVDFAWRSAVLGGHKTLVWDLDYQGGAAFLLGSQRREIPKASSIFQRDGRPRALVEPTQFPNLSLLQADNSLRSLGVSLARIGNNRRLAQITAQLRGEFDRIVLDCPPIINEVSDQVFHAVDVLLVPVPASPLAQRTFDMVFDELRRHHIRNLPVLPILSMYNHARPLHRAARYGKAENWPVIPVSPAIERAAEMRAPVGSFDAGSRADRALQRLWNGVEAKLAQRAVLAQQQRISA